MQTDAKSLILDRSVLERLHREAGAAAAHLDISRLLNAGRQALHAERFSDAEIILKGALVAEPRNAATWNLMAQLCEELGEIDAAEHAYREAIGLEGNEASVLALCRLLLSLARFEEAQALATWLLAHSDNPETRHGATQLEHAIAARRSHGR